MKITPERAVTVTNYKHSLVKKRGIEYISDTSKRIACMQLLDHSGGETMYVQYKWNREVGKINSLMRLRCP